MRNTYKKLGIFLGVLLLISATSCKKLLEQVPKNSTYQQVFWKNANDARYAISGNYALVRAAMTNYNDRYYMYGEAVAKNYFTIQYNGDGLEGIQNGDYTFQYNLENLGNYTYYYKAIAMSNIVIKNVSKMTDEQLQTEDNPTAFRNNILGQALFLRAFSYFMMVRVWGDVPIVTEAYDDPLTAPQLPRSPKADVMKLIEDDCHKAAGLLTWSYASAGDAKVTANAGAVYALLAHLYLWRATMLDVSTDNPNITDVNSADTTINTLMARGGYSLSDTSKYKSVFVGRSSEGIFEINMSENTLEGSNAGIGIRFLNQSYINQGSTNPRDFVVPNYLSEHYGSGSTDIRYTNNFELVSTTQPMCTKYSNVIYRNLAQKLDPYLSNNMIIFRLSDFILLKAEIALYKGDKFSAITIINNWRTRFDKNPNLIDDSYSLSDVMYEYGIERGKEFYLEGTIFYDLLRTREYQNHVDWLTSPRFKAEGYYWPVDPALFKQNPLLKQTKYWLGKV
ncbi:RagB/SusD family nutrient uptake outer membrane protein [Mucilaginibacter psychrotolerans]|uniref:RagB/SusD family nutrient uptake outer membrane protein n=1 Tax=Mucilaginibacter psychrotolerans TaxID=1524096 RepID=A0A4Y8SD42_9SPHI|nr:RagB/SusD family nutrient uptake outer membrane protein [Mucilaginibacter psychrotolerans]TFF36581.1 RagB/SusD family nutrient uptake outer membrane protein [Mucilaginibacter psychrotolerans]